MTGYPSLLLVFTAGFLSFLSPCILPLIPSYLSILGIVGNKEKYPAEQGSRQYTARKSILLITTVCFILGFTGVFIAFSIIMSATFFFMGGTSVYIRIAAGIIVIILGLNVLFDFISILNYEKRFSISGKLRGLPGAFIAGAAFGAGWTPCVGPILAGVLFLAGQSGKAGIAALYLGMYSFGLGIPFLLAAAFLDRFLDGSKWFRARMPLIQKISGTVLVIIGLIILSGHFSILNTALQKWQFQYIDWAQDKAIPFRVLADLLGWAGGQ